MSLPVIPAGPGWYMLVAAPEGDDGWTLWSLPIIGWRVSDCEPRYALGQPVLPEEVGHDSATLAVLSPDGDVYVPEDAIYDDLVGFVREMTRRFNKPLASKSVKLRVASERALGLREEA